MQISVLKVFYEDYSTYLQKSAGGCRGHGLEVYKYGNHLHIQKNISNNKI